MQLPVSCAKRGDSALSSARLGPSLSPSLSLAEHVHSEGDFDAPRRLINKRKGSSPGEAGELGDNARSAILQLRVRRARGSFYKF